MTSISNDIKAVILDIEGTITTISFVHDVMFTYIRNHVHQYLNETWETETTQEDIKQLFDQSARDAADGVKGIHLISSDLQSSPKDDIVTDLVQNVLSQMDIDRKIASLKGLQGHMWNNAFTQGIIQAELFSDVYPSLERWHAQGKNVCIYSSGSVHAQKLLLGHTERGDLLGLFSGFFDTVNAGHKRESTSYTAIATHLEIDPQDCLFLSDVYEEVAACDAAGMHGMIVVRPGNTAVIPESNTFPLLTSFDTVFP